MKNNVIVREVVITGLRGVEVGQYVSQAHTSSQRAVTVISIVKVVNKEITIVKAIETK